MSLAIAFPLLTGVGLDATAAEPVPRQTTVRIVGDDFQINNQPTYAGRMWKGHRIEGLLLNSRMVQATFDDLNPETAKRWVYPDTAKWDAERNVREFVAALPEWKRHGLLAVTVNFQGGSPEGYSGNQRWETGAFTAEGGLRPEFADRMRRVLDAADAHGMVVIVGYFYFGQSPRFTGDEAVIRATDEATRWLLQGGWRNVLVEINNETNPTYKPAMLRPDRVSELIQRVRAMKATDGRRLLVGTSFGGCVVPTTNVVAVSDFLLIHGNGANKPEIITDLIRKTRAVPTFKPMPVLINEDDHENFDQPENNFTAALREHVSWGWFDYRREGESWDEGYQSPSVKWGLSSERKRAFFKFCAEITGTEISSATRAKPAGLEEVRKPIRNFTVWKDTDGKGYIVYDDGHRNMRVDLLADDYLSSSGRTTVALQSDRAARKVYEGAAMIRYRGKYLVAGSGVKGWNPTDTTYAVADAPLGPYREMELMSEQNTWQSQMSVITSMRTRLPVVLFGVCLSLTLWTGEVGAAHYDPLAVETDFKPAQLDLTVPDAKRNRDIPVRVYLPANRTPAPVVLFSHGLGGTRNGNRFLGEHWAARGYVVVFLHHPGSDDSVWRDKPLTQRMPAMNSAASLNNFLLRVQDVTAVLNQLEVWHADTGNALAGRLEKKVGMSGHSFGAITTQAVSGQAFAVGGQRFTEPRIKAAIAFSPSTPRRGSADEAFGAVKIPWLLMTGTKDLAPIGQADMESRLGVYPALRGAAKYELVLHNAEHSAFTDRALPGDREPRNPNHHRVILALSTAFWDAYLRGDADALAWLNGSGPRSVMEASDRWQFSVK